MHQAYRPKRPRARRPLSLLEFIRERGGIRPDQPEAGDLRAMDLHKERCKSGVKILRPRPGLGMMMDHAAEVACEAGYIRAHDIAELMDAIDSELRGRPVYALAGVDAVPLPTRALEPELEPARRGPGRPPKAEGALVPAPPFRVHPADIDLAVQAAQASGEAYGTFARRCFLLGLAALAEEAF